MKTVAIEDIYASTILSFCENLAELGYRPEVSNGRFMGEEDIEEVSPDMWYRNLSPKEQRKIAVKLIKIEERDAKRFAKESKRKNKNE